MLTKHVRTRSQISVRSIIAIIVMCHAVVRASDVLGYGGPQRSLLRPATPNILVVHIVPSDSARVICFIHC